MRNFKITFFSIILLCACSQKQKINFIVRRCDGSGVNISIIKPRLFKAKAPVTYGNGEFITYLSEGNNNLILEEGYYYIDCLRQFESKNDNLPSWNMECYKFFDVQGNITEYDLCNIYNRGDWSPK